MPSLSPSQIRTLRLLKRTAIVYLLLRYLDQPAGEVEVARILEINRGTARKYLRALTDIGLVTRAHYRDGYTITNKGRQMFPGEPRAGRSDLNRMVVKPPATPLNTVVNDSDIEEVNKEALTGPLVKESPVEADLIWQALAAAGIKRNRRTERLAQMAHITPEYIQAHHRALVDSGRGEAAGLLVTILESGERPPNGDPSTGLDPDIEYLRLNPFGSSRQSAYDRLKARGVPIPNDIDLEGITRHGSS